MVILGIHLLWLIHSFSDDPLSEPQSPQSIIFIVFRHISLFFFAHLLWCQTVFCMSVCSDDTVESNPVISKNEPSQSSSCVNTSSAFLPTMCFFIYRGECFQNIHNDALLVFFQPAPPPPLIPIMYTYRNPEEITAEYVRGLAGGHDCPENWGPPQKLLISVTVSDKCLGLWPL